MRPPRAIGLYRIGAAEEHRDAMFALGRSYDLGAGVHRDDAQASHWFLKGVEQGDGRAMVFLGLHYMNGRDRPIDKAAGAALFARAADQGSGRGLFMLAQCMEAGDGVPRDEAGAPWARRIPKWR
jgi:TPR repeat protein